MRGKRESQREERSTNTFYNKFAKGRGREEEMKRGENREKKEARRNQTLH